MQELITIGELIKELQNQDPNSVVVSKFSWSLDGKVAYGYVPYNIRVGQAKVLKTGSFLFEDSSASTAFPVVVVGD